MNKSALEEFDDLQIQMNEFSARVEKQLTEKRSNLINDKQDHYIKLNDLKNQELKLQVDINNLKKKESKIKETIKESLEALQLQQLKVNELTEKQDSLLEQKGQLQSEIDELSKEIDIIGQKLNKSQESIANQLRKDYPELVKFELYLGLKIEVIEIDLIRFIFNNIDPNNFDREFWVELSVKEDEFKVGRSDPPLKPESIKLLEDEFNDHKAFIKFLKTSRNMFKDLI